MKDVVKLDNPKGACSSHECETYGNSYKYQPNNYAVLEKSDFDNPKLKSIKASDIEAFVDPLRMKFSEINFEDRSRDTILKLVDSIVDGKNIISIVLDKDEAPVINIMSALKKSIEDTKCKYA